MPIDYQCLWERLADQAPLRGTGSIHGPPHWRRVEQNGLRIAERTPGVSVIVVRLFAAFHDSRRLNDGRDPRHGARGAALAEAWRGELFDLPDADFERLLEACRGHTYGTSHDDLTVRACWDADRLDLTRCGIQPDPRRLLTPAGQVMARALPGYRPPRSAIARNPEVEDDGQGD